MRVFRYQAVTASGQMVGGELPLENLESLYLALSERGLTLVDVKERRGFRLPFVRGAGTRDEIVEFTRSMASLLEAGVPILQVLEDLAEHADRRAWRATLADIRGRVESGSTFSEALEAHPKSFDDVYLSLVRAGEAGGSLDRTLQKLAHFLDWDAQVRRDLRRALSYPLSVLGAIVGFIAVLMFFVFPRLGGLIETLEVEVPLYMRIMVGGGHAVLHTWPILVGSILAGAILFGRLRATPSGRRAIDACTLRLPLIGAIIEMGAFSRFTNTLGTLLNAGVPLDRALGLSADAVGNRAIMVVLKDVQHRLQSGETFSQSLEHSGRVPSRLLRMVRVGEAQGDLPGMLDQVTSYYDRELPHVVRKMVSAVGPIAVVILAVTVGGAAVSLFTLLMRINDAIR